MEIDVQNDFCIITPLSPIINKYQAERLSMEIKNYLNFKVGINMTYVEDCTIDFIEKLNLFKNISLFNITSDIFAIFNIMGLDKSANLYVSENDFKSNKHRLLNRQFKIV